MSIKLEGRNDDYFPLHIFLQRVDEYGVEIGDAVNTKNDALIHIQVGEHLVNPRYRDEDIDAHFQGEFTVQEREFSETKCHGDFRNRSLTIFIRERT